PGLLAPRLVDVEDGLTERVLDPLEIDLDRVADLDVCLAPRPREFTQRDPALGLGRHVYDGDILLDRVHRSLDHSAFLRTALGEGFFQHFREIFARRLGRTNGGGHEHSLKLTTAPVGYMGAFPQGPKITFGSRRKHTFPLRAPRARTHGSQPGSGGPGARK